MSITSWIFPLLIIFAIVITVMYFLGRRKNLVLIREYAQAMEKILKPTSQQYTWLGGYIGFKAEYKVKQEIVGKVKPTLHMMPRLSLLYYPVAKLTMRHDKLYIVMETSRNIDGEAHLIQKGYYRLGPSIKNIEKFHKRYTNLGDIEFEMLYQDGKGESRLLSLAQGFTNVDSKRIKHLSFTSSTNVIYALVDPSLELLPILFTEMLNFAGKVVK